MCFFNVVGPPGTTDISPILGVIGGAIGALVLLVVAGVLITFYSHKKKRRQNSQEMKKNKAKETMIR